MRRAWRRYRNYWQLWLGVKVAIAAGILDICKLHLAAHLVLLAGIIVLGVALVVRGWQNLQHGSYDFSLLPLATAITAVLLHHYWIGLAVIGLEILLHLAWSLLQKRQARQQLADLLPQDAVVLRGRKQVTIAAAKLLTADKVLVENGTLVPADGVVLEGESSLSIPLPMGAQVIQVHAGDTVLGGARNDGEAITVKITRPYSDSYLPQLVGLQRAADPQHAPFVALSARFSLFFAITAFIIAGAAWAIGHHAIRFLDVMVIATVWPLLFAPLQAFSKAIRRLQSTGVLTKSAATVERLADSETVSFDLPGTLLEAEQHIIAITPLGSWKTEDLLRVAAALTAASSEPFARTITKAATERQLNVPRSKHVESHLHGLLARVQGKDILVGNALLLEEHGITVPLNKKSDAHDFVYVVQNGVLAGSIQISSAFRPDAKAFVHSLQSQKLHTVLLSAYPEAVLSAMTKDYHFDETFAEQTGAQKLHIIEKLQQRPIAYLGSDEDEASLLHAADVGIMRTEPAHLATARRLADIVVLSDYLQTVSTSLRTARGALSIARQSLLLGSALSLVMMLVFATGKVPAIIGVPIVAAIDALAWLAANRNQKAGSSS